MKEHVSITGPNVDKVAKLLDEGHHSTISVEESGQKLTFVGAGVHFGPCVPLLTGLRDIRHMESLELILMQSAYFHS